MTATRCITSLFCISLFITKMRGMLSFSHTRGACQHPVRECEGMWQSTAQLQRLLPVLEKIWGHRNEFGWAPQGMLTLWFVSTHNSFSNGVFLDSVLTLLQNIKWFLMYSCHLRLYFSCLPASFKSKVFREGDLYECKMYERQSSMFFSLWADLDFWGLLVVKGCGNLKSLQSFPHSWK